MGNTTGIQYPYANDEDGNLVHIDSVNKECRHSHTYTCPCCGSTMTPRLGEINAHCFAHEGNKSCGQETYIHSVGKKILAWRYDHSKEFIISFNRTHVCKENKNCEFFDEARCQYQSYEEFDLKEHYDKPAQIEHTINGTFRADVALTSSNPQREPILLEVYHKHKSTQDKLNSNICIEFHVRQFSDLVRLMNCPISEDKDITFHNFKPRRTNPDEIAEHIQTAWPGKVSDIREWDYPVCKQSESCRMATSNYERLTLLRDGSFEKEQLLSMSSPHRQDALADVTYHSGKVSMRFNPMYFLATRFPEARKCYLCRNYMVQGNDSWCTSDGQVFESKSDNEMCKAIHCKSFQIVNWLCFPIGRSIEGKDFIVWRQQ